MSTPLPRARDRIDDVLRWAAVLAATMVFAAVCEPLWATVEASPAASPSHASATSPAAPAR
jgi:hypothetical protein